MNRLLLLTALLWPVVSVIAEEPKSEKITPATATKEQPFVNTLEMKFVPVPGTKVLFCIHDTRKRDYQRYAQANPGVSDGWKKVKYHGVLVSSDKDHPVVNVSWLDAKAFSEWLSKKEGRTYRLPTDYEWSVAVGIGEREVPDASPETKIGKIQHLYPWGTSWPPPAGTGNFADLAFKKEIPAPYNHSIIAGYTDGYATTSPVMSFAPSKIGLYDMSGNVWQWCEDRFNSKESSRVLRGSSWCDACDHNLLSCSRGNLAEDRHDVCSGFRCVLEQ